jgi:hypothetical protein
MELLRQRLIPLDYFLYLLVNNITKKFREKPSTLEEARKKAVEICDGSRLRGALTGQFERLLSIKAKAANNFHGKNGFFVEVTLKYRHPDGNQIQTNQVGLELSKDEKGKYILKEHVGNIIQRESIFITEVIHTTLNTLIN